MPTRGIWPILYDPTVKKMKMYEINLLFINT